ncbi:hypothetical protein ACFQX6_17185 [Streptosporangium lutulentum]
MDTESLERPTLVRTPEGRWRLYLSCATYGTKHWRVEVLEADDPSGFDPGNRRMVLPGDPKTGVKDPVIVRRGDMWHLWASCHPLAEPEEADQMVSDYATSADGLEWIWQGTALSGRPGLWDARGRGSPRSVSWATRWWPSTTAGPPRRRTTRRRPVWPSVSTRRC